MQKLRESIFYMFEVYANERDKNSANRFLDSLTTKNRVILYETPLIDEAKYSKTVFDEKWEKAVKAL